jgi:hypothetical protein
MAALKEGSKGKEVEALQTRLNKLGAKPALKIDGIFGPLTHKSVLKFQKDAKLKKKNGVVDNETVAALQFGGALPEMTVPNLKDAAKACKDFQRHNLVLLSYLSALDSAASNLRTSIDSTLPPVTKMADSNKPL